MTSKKWKIKKDNIKINLFEAFSGIGSQHQALKNIGFDVNVVWISDWYIDAIIAYWINHLDLNPIKIDKIEVIEFLKKYSLSRNSKNPLKSFWWLSDDKLSILYQVIKKFWILDIRDISWEKLATQKIDLFTYSFPCQDISQQWKRTWFSKDSCSRSWLLWEIERILLEINKIWKERLPKVLLMENVKAILNKEFSKDLDLWIAQLEKLWYKSSKPFIVNSSDIWSPQNRQRVFMISKLEDNDIENFEIKTKNKKKYLKDILTKDDYRDKLSKDKYDHLEKIETNKWIKKWILRWYTTFNSENYVYYLDWQTPTITASWAQSRIKFLWEDNEICFLNGLEHLLLQWFDERFYKKLKDFWFTDTKIKFLAWNSINVWVLEEIFKFYL